MESAVIYILNHQHTTEIECARNRLYTGKPTITINGQIIKQVQTTKFLGVTIDEKLSWVPHIENLCTKLKSQTGMLNRIKRNIPAENYKSLYFALFESHMRYCITVFGCTDNNTLLEKIFRAQKHCIRILFGDFEVYMENAKIRKNARENEQKLVRKFYIKENTKPLFKKLGILAFQNVYNYQMCLEMLKILKYEIPRSLYDIFNLSDRNSGTLLIPPSPSISLAYKGPKIWNAAMKILAKDSKLNMILEGTFKRKVKECLLDIQNKYDSIEWYEYNFIFETANKT